jgi:hypothetical protein
MDLKPLFSPETIAVIGVFRTNDPGGFSNRMPNTC